MYSTSSKMHLNTIFLNKSNYHFYLIILLASPFEFLKIWKNSTKTFELILSYILWVTIEWDLWVFSSHFYSVVVQINMFKNLNSSLNKVSFFSWFWKCHNVFRRLKILICFSELCFFICWLVFYQTTLGVNKIFSILIYDLFHFRQFHNL